MIEKIIRITNVGKFRDYSCSGDVSLRPLTLIYGGNAEGKTTLAAILRSLSQQKADPITERQTLGQPGTPLTELLIDGHKVAFKDGAWDASPPSVAIFDPVFVRENVHAGDVVEHDHRRRLYEFAIGEEAVGLAHRIEEYDDQIDRELNPAIRSMATDIQEHAGPMPVQEFVALEPVEDIEHKMTAKRSQVLALREADKIAKRPGLGLLHPPDAPFGEMEELLASTLEDVSAEAEQMVREHVAGCGDEAVENWINEGMAYIRHCRCPFCAQGIRGVDLIGAYRKYFSQAYRDLKAEIAEMSHRVNESLSAERILELQQIEKSNRELAELWKEHTRIREPRLDPPRLREPWEQGKQVLLGLLQSKSASPLQTIPVPDRFREAREACDGVAKAIADYNRRVCQANSRIEAKREEVQATDLDTATTELKPLRTVSKRHEGPVAKLCSKYTELQQKKAKLDEKKRTARKELAELTSTVLQTYEAAINAYLRKFGADFEIVDIGESHRGGKPRIDYRIAINDVPFDVGPSDASVPAPYFGNTLSSGDRSTLALAFFLAALDQDPGLHARMVVFDDPISSLDRDRKACTQQCIARMLDRAEQVIVMSHDPHFLRLIWENAPKAERKVLSIRRATTGNVIRQCDIMQETRADYFRNHAALRKYLDGGAEGRDLRDLARRLRLVLEENLRYRFPGSFGPTDWLGDMLEKAREAEAGIPLCALGPLLEELSHINDYSKQYHHGHNENADTTPITDRELRTHVERTLALLSGVPA